MIALGGQSLTCRWARDEYRRRGARTAELRLGGLIIFFIMRALGELLLYRQPGSFAARGDSSAFAGFIRAGPTGFTWVTIRMAEITAVCNHYWFPDIPSGYRRW